MFFKAGNTEDPPIPKARQSVNEVTKIDPPACLMDIPIHSINSFLKIEKVFFSHK